METKNTTIEQLKAEIAKIKRENEETIEQIKQDVQFEIMDIDSKSKQNQN